MSTGTLLTLAPAAALALGATTLGTLPRAVSGGWLLYSVAAGLAVIAQVQRHAMGAELLPQLLDGTAAALLVVGALWAFPRRTWNRWRKRILPLSMVAASAVTATLHWRAELLPGLVSAGWWLFWACMAAAAWRRSMGAGPLISLDTSRRITAGMPVVVGLILAALALDVLTGASLSPAAQMGVLLTGLLLAARSWQLLQAANARAADRLALAHSRALIEVSQALSGERGVDETLDLVTSWAVRLLDGRAAVLELLTLEGDQLELHAVHGLPQEMIGLRFPVDGSFTGWVVKHGRARSTTDARVEPLLHGSAARYLGRSALAAVPLTARCGTLGVLACLGRRPFTDADVELLSAFASQATAAIETARLFRQVHQLSVTDPLTGLSNRRQLERDLSREFSAARRGRRLIVVMFDLNEFKEYNDRHGHVAGDEALRAFATALAAETRAMNMAARYGGDEFIAILADTSAAGAATFIERVAASFPPPGSDPRLSELGFAAGFAEYEPHMQEPRDLVAAADRALYNHKLPRCVRT